MGHCNSYFRNCHNLRPLSFCLCKPNRQGGKASIFRAFSGRLCRAVWSAQGAATPRFLLLDYRPTFPGLKVPGFGKMHDPKNTRCGAVKAVCFALRGQLSHPWVEKRTQGHNAPHRAALRTDPPTVGSDALQQLQHSEIPGTVRDFAVSDSVTQPIRSSYM